MPTLEFASDDELLFTGTPIVREERRRFDRDSVSADDTIRVMAHVIYENAFGGRVRDDIACSVRVVGGEWSVISVLTY